MTRAEKSSITGTGAVCGAGMDAGRRSSTRSRDGRSAIAPIAQWDTAGWPCRIAAEIADFNPRALVDDRKLHKLIRRTDLFGLYAAGRAIERPGIVAHRDALDGDAAAALQRPHRRLRRLGRRQLREPVRLLSADDRGRRRAAGVRPRARATPSIRCGCCARCRTTCWATSASSTASRARTPASPITASAARWRSSRRPRRCATARPTARSPSATTRRSSRRCVLYYHQLRPARDARRCGRSTRAHDGSLFGEGAGALVARDRGVGARRATRRCWAKCSAAAMPAKAQGLLAIRDDGDGLARAIGAGAGRRGARARRRRHDRRARQRHAAVRRLGSGGDPARVRRRDARRSPASSGRSAT